MSTDPKVERPNLEEIEARLNSAYDQMRHLKTMIVSKSDIRELLTYARSLEAQAERERGGAEVALLSQERERLAKFFADKALECKQTAEGAATFDEFQMWEEKRRKYHNAGQALQEFAALSTQTEGKPS